jgi:hypothetical protein
MEAFLTPLQVQKGGNAVGEYEDAYYPPDNGRREGPELRFAIADGASEGMLSGAWANILVRVHCQFDWLCGSVEQFLESAYGDWSSFTSEYLKDREGRHPVQWYEEPGFQEGAFSTLLGLTLTGSSTRRGGEWAALAVGDSCVFQVRGGALVKKFPMEQSSDFNSRPVLLASNPARNDPALGAVRWAGGTFEAGDAFYLMTDALARWSLKEDEDGRNPWARLRDFGPGDAPAFDRWIDGLRQAKEMRNDDITLIRIDLPRMARALVSPGGIPPRPTALG